MLEVGVEIQVRFLDDPQKQLHRAVIVRADSEALVAEFAHAARALIGAQVQLYYSLDRQCVRSTATVQACLQEKPRPVISFKSVSGPEPWDLRKAFRVFIRASEITAQIGTLPASIVDVSVEGFGVISPSRWNIDSVVQAILQFEDQEFSGRACVCNFTKLEHNQTRYGLQVLKEEASLRNGLQRIATDLQQRQLRPPTQ